MLRNAAWALGRGSRRPRHVVSQCDRLARALSTSLPTCQVAEASTEHTHHDPSLNRPSRERLDDLKDQLANDKRLEETSKVRQASPESLRQATKGDKSNQDFIAKLALRRGDSNYDGRQGELVADVLPNQQRPSVILRSVPKDGSASSDFNGKFASRRSAKPEDAAPPPILQIGETKRKSNRRSKKEVDDSAAKFSSRRTGESQDDSPPDYLKSEESAEKPEKPQRGWYSGGILHRKSERQLGLAKSWSHRSPNHSLKMLLITRPDDEDLRKETARARTIRMPLVLMQWMIRQQEEAKKEGSELLDLLPDRQTWDNILAIHRNNGHSEEALESYLKILLGENDQERCIRYLEDERFKPIWILNFLIRSTSQFQADTLPRLLDRFRKDLCFPRQPLDSIGLESRGPLKRSLDADLNMNPQAFNHTTTLFARHCMRFDPRLLVKLAKIISRYLKSLRQGSDSDRMLYHQQCLVFNHGLRLFQPAAVIWNQRQSMPNAYLWEAQRILLETSGSFPKPLLLSHGGFRALRAVLAGLRKSQGEKHNTQRHSETWPPYLIPGDGMDEKMDAEEAWSRTVRAGMMMQEAGFPKEATDEALDILQGLAPDGTPTIQQRVTVTRKWNISSWAAAIKATRNVHEAWARFQDPPIPGQKPGLDEYAIMFEKLFARNADAVIGTAPGDNSLNYPTQEEANLAEFERARLEPPSVDELYQKMRLSGFRPRDQCLRILLANAGSPELAHRYLIESDIKMKLHENLLMEEPDPELLRKLPGPVFSAYIESCLRQSGGARSRLNRALKLTFLRQSGGRRNGQYSIWMPILKQVGQHRLRLGIGLSQQLRILLQLGGFLHTECGFPLPLLKQYFRCIQRILRREIRVMIKEVVYRRSEDSESHEAVHLYDQESSQLQTMRKVVEDFASTNKTGVSPDLEGNLDNLSPLYLLCLVAFRMKEAFYALVEQEKRTSESIDIGQISALDAMLSRKDAVGATYAHTYMLALAYLGEFQEMAKVLKWLMTEWGKPELMQELDELDDVPAEADMVDTLCVFRAFAEPMLPKEETASVLDTLNATEVGWLWPNDEVVQGYINPGKKDAFHGYLSSMLRWTREQQAVRALQQGQTGETTTRECTGQR